MASKAILPKHYARILNRWPQDRLRPDRPFQALLQKRHERVESITDANTNAELRNVNALYSLLDDRYAKRFPFPKELLHPESNPRHYDDLIADIEATPTRTHQQSFWIWLKGKVRFK